MVAGFEKMDAAHERHQQLQGERMVRNDQFRNRRFSHFAKLSWAGVAAAAAIVGIVLYVLLWGDEAQRQVAIMLLNSVFLFVGIIIGRYTKNQ